MAISALVWKKVAHDVALVGHSGEEYPKLWPYPNLKRGKISQHCSETFDWLPVSLEMERQCHAPPPSEQDVRPQSLHARCRIRRGADNAHKLRLRHLFWGAIDIFAFDSSSSV